MWFDRGKDRASEDIPLVNSVTQLQDEGLRGKVGQWIGVRGSAARACSVHRPFQTCVSVLCDTQDLTPYCVPVLDPPSRKSLPCMQASSLMATLFCNAALCLLKQHLNDDAIYAARSATGSALLMCCPTV